MTQEPRLTNHPEVETLAAFAEGRAEGWSRTELIAHLDRCEECMHEVTLAIRTYRDEPAQMPRRAARAWWLGAAAAAAIVAIVFFLAPFRRDPLGELVAAAPRSARTVEPRLSGGFPWATYHGAARADDTKPDAARYKLTGVAGDLVQRAESDSGADAQHAAGVALVLLDDPAAAIRHLELAAKTRGDANAWSDLAAARYAAAVELGRASLYPEALAAADAALRIDASHAEALFNRALVLERMGLFDQARRAWTQYLEADPSSPWANEARTRLRELPAARRSSPFDEDRPQAERAALAGDAQTLRTLVDRHRERARAFTEAEYLGLWGEAVLAGDGEAAARNLTIARAFAGALRELSGESLPHDAVAAIDAATPPVRQMLAEAHVAYRRGRMAYKRVELAAGERDLLRAAEAFAAARSPMALVARYYAASVQMARHDLAGARAELERQLAETARYPRYLALPAAIRWELGRIHYFEGDPDAAASVLTPGVELYRRAGEHANEAFLEAIRAAVLLSLGRADDGWDARIRAFTTLSREGAPRLLATTVGDAARNELLAERREPALTLLRLEAFRESDDVHPANALDALVSRAMLEAAAGDHAAALATVQRARAAAQAFRDDAFRGGVMADVDVAEGAALAVRDPQAAAAALTRAIDFYRRHQHASSLPEPLLLRAGCALRGRDAASAARDLEEGMAVVERTRTEPASVVLGTGVLHAEHALFEEAIRVALDRGDAAGAFTIAERARGAAFTIAELQQRLRGCHCAVLRVITLPGEVVTIAVDENEMTVARRERSAESLAALAAESLAEHGTAAAAALYDDFIRPAEPLLARASEVIVIPDRRSAGVPWAALYDTTTRRHLIERVAVATATRASELAPARRHVMTATATVIALPATAEADPLVETDRELSQIAGAYPRAATIARGQATLAAATRAGTDVLHLAGHTERQPAGGEHALLFATAGGEGIERITARTIAAGPRLDAHVVVLAACRTMRHPGSEGTRAPSLAEAFAAAGAAHVVGTLTPIGDRDARRLFEAFHRELARGAAPAEALRAAQRAAIGEQQGGGSRAWRQVALLTRQLPGKESGSWASSP